MKEGNKKRIAAFALAGLLMTGCGTPDTVPATQVTDPPPQTNQTDAPPPPPPQTEPVTEPVTESTLPLLPEVDTSLLLLVNQDNPLPEDYAVELQALNDWPLYVAKALYPDLKAMLAEGIAQGLSFQICSAYRSYDFQQQLFDEDVERYKNEGMTEEEAYAAAAALTMPPGCSEHHTGLALDIVATSNQRLDGTQESTAETQWLHENCWKYGFVLRYPPDKSDITGIAYESWHYRYVGKEVAKYMTENDLTLEEFTELMGEDGV